MSASTPAPCFAPKPPPMNSEITRTLSLGSPNREASSRRASNMPCVETHAVSRSPSQRATAAWGSSGVWTCAGVSQRQLDEHLGSRDRRVGIAADRLARLLGEPLLLETGVEVERGELLVLERERRDPLGQRVPRVGCDGGDRVRRPSAARP